MTQAQWLRATGSIPSGHRSGAYAGNLARRISWTHPVESVTWTEAIDALGRWNLTLPTELQWEAAARAGTPHPLTLENDVRLIEGSSNFRDAAFARIQDSAQVAPWDDGFALHTPVGSFAPDPLGLHDLNGNVSELLLDWYCDTLGERHVGHVVPGTGELVPLGHRIKHTYRGSSWMSHPRSASATARNPVQPSFKDLFLGVRAVVPLP